MGPCHATGSCIGFPEISRNLVDFSLVLIEMFSPSPYTIRFSDDAKHVSLYIPVFVLISDISKLSPGSK